MITIINRVTTDRMRDEFEFDGKVLNEDMEEEELMELGEEVEEDEDEDEDEEESVDEEL